MSGNDRAVIVDLPAAATAPKELDVRLGEAETDEAPAKVADKE